MNMPKRAVSNQVIGGFYATGVVSHARAIDATTGTCRNTNRMDVDTTEGSTAHQRVRVIYVAMMGAVFVYAGIAIQMSLVTENSEPVLTGSTPWVVRVALAAVAVIGQLIIAIVIGGMTRPKSGGQLQKSLVATQVLSSISMLRVAFAEAIGIYGLLLYLLGNNLVDTFAFCAAALVVLAMQFPTRTRWDRDLERIRRAWELS
ncbi:MAG: hypothetical protein AB7J35_19880 [Dehalococcoidia bacterium]